MKVIYAGFPKTGTKTMADAFRILGLKCYDFMENYEHLGDDWMKILTQGGSVEDFRKMYKDVDAVTDIPCCYFWEELLNAFPEAKLIVGFRATEDEWYESFKKQRKSRDRVDLKIMSLLSPTCADFMAFMQKNVEVVFGVHGKFSLFEKLSVNEMLFRKSYRAHNLYVLQNAPEDKLHVVDFKQGWEPLCQFLGVPVPSQPFPHSNRNANFTQKVISTHPIYKQVKTEAFVTLCLLVIVVLGSIVLLSYVYP